MKTETYTLPAFWASALVNGDYSGLLPDDEKLIDAWLDAYPELGGCLSCSDESSFTRWHDAPAVLACDCLEFTFAAN